MLYKNNGVETVTADGTTDVNSAKSVEITTKIKEWIDKGYAYYAYGTNASTNMRSCSGDGGAFSVFHTSSMYDTYLTNVAASADPFEVGMAQAARRQRRRVLQEMEVGGSAILIPAAASQAEKNAAWQFMMFATSPEINPYWADKTGYFPTRASVQGSTPEYEEYLSRKPAMADIASMSSWINPATRTPPTTPARTCGGMPCTDLQRGRAHPGNPGRPGGGNPGDPGRSVTLHRTRQAVCFRPYRHNIPIENFMAGRESTLSLPCQKRMRLVM